MVPVPCKVLNNTCCYCYFVVTENGRVKRTNKYCVMTKYYMSGTGHFIGMLMSIVLQGGSRYLLFKDEQTGERE